MNVCTLCAASGALKLKTEQFLLGGSWSHLIIVVHEVHLMTATICSTATPVVNHIVKYILVTVVSTYTIQSAAQTPVSSFAMSQQVVVIRAHLESCRHFTAADGCCISVGCTCTIVRMTCHIECFGNQGALKGKTLGVAAGECLIDGPGDRAMVHDGIVVACHSHTVESVYLIFIADGSAVGLLMSQTHTEETGDTFACHTERTAAEHDAVAWGSLSGDGYVFVAAGESLFQRDDARHIKDDGAWTGCFLDAVTERTLYRILIIAVIFECGYVINASASTARSILTISFGTREGEMTGTETPYIAFVYCAGSIFLVNSPVIGVEVGCFVECIFCLGSCGYFSKTVGICTY